MVHAEVIVDGPQITVKVRWQGCERVHVAGGLKRKGGFEHNVLGSGTFALQGHDPGSEAHFKNIMVKPLP